MVNLKINWLNHKFIRDISLLDLRKMKENWEIEVTIHIQSISPKKVNKQIPNVSIVPISTDFKANILIMYL
jgi:hypothetical protein